MLAIERDNPSLKGVLPKDYAHPRLDKQRLGQLIDMVGNIGLGDKENRSKDILGRVYDPCCGSGGMFVQSVEFVKAHANGNGNGGKTRALPARQAGDVSIFVQESNHTTWRLANGSMSSNQSGEGMQGRRMHLPYRNIATSPASANPPPLRISAITASS
jgi:type I restriction enzyme M protein